jgi:Zn-finger nucleic acid-binding protein
MKCPIDGADLVMTERQGIEIDYCPKCRGVWLDRGELDKIIERAASTAPYPTAAAPPPSAPPPQPSGQTFGGQPYPTRDERPREYDRPRHDDDDDDYRKRGYDPRSGKPYHKKRGGLLGELFDFD